MTPVTADTRPARNGPILRQVRPDSILSGTFWAAAGERSAKKSGQDARRGVIGILLNWHRRARTRKEYRRAGTSGQGRCGIRIGQSGGGFLVEPGTCTSRGEVTYQAVSCRAHW